LYFLSFSARQPVPAPEYRFPVALPHPVLGARGVSGSPCASVPQAKPADVGPVWYLAGRGLC